jgi:hypothetical protein
LWSAALGISAVFVLASLFILLMDVIPPWAASAIFGAGFFLLAVAWMHEGGLISL